MWDKKDCGEEELECERLFARHVDKHKMLMRIDDARKTETAEEADTKVTTAEKRSERRTKELKKDSNPADDAWKTKTAEETDTKVTTAEKRSERRTRQPKKSSNPSDDARKNETTEEADTKVTTTDSMRSVIIQPGYGRNFPKWLLQKMDFELECEARKYPTIKLTRTMLVLSSKGSALEKFDLGDWVYALNDVTLRNKQQYFSMLKKFIRKNEPYKLKFTIYRTVKTIKIANVNLSPFIPQATEMQSGYSYLLGYITMYPGSSLGINIKSYNYKVCIVIERADSPRAIQQVKVALAAEKTRDIDPRMPDDVIDLCKTELNRMSLQKTFHPISIYRSGNLLQRCFTRRGREGVRMAAGSVETGIGMDPINPILLQHVPPPPGPRPNVPIIHPESANSLTKNLKASAAAKRRKSSPMKKAAAGSHFSRTVVHR
ncbi:unnamed protein product [Anisakis simplex]|uniref:PDZ domain-containing protein n=1 Tax=Anisakis simplex TaxID=6269 RepID=A0A0M3JZK0_ANISI|nr:unnamed protein product [Anisakis simplex]